MTRRRLGLANIPRSCLLALLPALPPMASWLPTPARAEDLPALLVAAANLIPADENGRVRCANIDAPSLPVRAQADAQAVPPADGGDYGLSTRGAFLDRGEAGQPGRPLEIALLEAGAAKRFRIREPRQVQVPNPVRGAGLPLWATRVETVAFDAILVTGRDAALFPSALSPFGANRPPAVDGGVDPSGEPLNSAAASPPGVWPGGRICLTEVPVRVLEYGDVEVRANGLRFVSAAMLFRAERVPPWLGDPRVTLSLYRPLVPQEVRFVGFRDDGDGWRVAPLADFGLLERPTHLVEGN